MAVLRARQGFFVGITPRFVAAGELFDSSDPVVKGRESLFEDALPRVETATAAPGEVRNRSRKTAKPE